MIQLWRLQLHQSECLPLWATEVGHGNLFGINSATIPSIKVGNNNKIAAGMVLDQNIGDDSVVFYRFKERVIAIPK